MSVTRCAHALREISDRARYASQNTRSNRSCTRIHLREPRAVHLIRPRRARAPNNTSEKTVKPEPTCIFPPPPVPRRGAHTLPSPLFHRHGRAPETRPHNPSGSLYEDAGHCLQRWLSRMRESRDLQCGGTPFEKAETGTKSAKFKGEEHGRPAVFQRMRLRGQARYYRAEQTSGKCHEGSSFSKHTFLLSPPFAYRPRLLLASLFAPTPTR